jgi:hypothetical protein
MMPNTVFRIELWKILLGVSVYTHNRGLAESKNCATFNSLTSLLT